MANFNPSELVHNMKPYFVLRGESIDTLQIDKSVIAGDGLTGGGVLTSDVVLHVGEGPGLDVTADTIALKPALSVTTESANTVSTTGHSHSWNTIPISTYTTDLGTINKKYLQIHAAELWVDNLVAQDTLATIGGRVLVGPTTWLVKDLAITDTTLYAAHNQFTMGDIVYLEKSGNLEFISIGSAPSSGSELLANLGFETPGAGPPAFASWSENLSDGAVSQVSEPANSSRQGAYIEGDYASASSQAAYIAGPGSDTVSSAGAYLTGGGTLVKNASFEDVDITIPIDFDDWIEVTGLEGYVIPGHSGTYGAYLSEGNSGEIYQDISVVGSATYNLSFWARYSAGHSIGRYSVYDVTNASYLITVTAATDGGIGNWTETTDNFTTASNTAIVRIQFTHPSTINDACGFDVVSLVATYAPSSQQAYIEGVYYNTVQAGTYAAKIESGPSMDTYIYQNETSITGGNIYTFSFWTRGDGLNAGRYSVRDNTNGGEIKPLTEIFGGESQTYQQISVNFTAPETCTSVAVRLYGPETDGGVAYFDTTSLVDAGYSYTVIRDLDGTGLDAWYTGDAIFNTGSVGDGFIDLYSIQGVVNASSQGPTIVGNVRTLTSSEILQNNGFETAGGGDPDFWANWTETAGDGTLANETSLVYAGSDAAKIITGVSDNTKIEQAQTVTGDTPYVLTFWTRGDGATAGRYGIWDYTNSAWIISQVTTGVSGATYTQVTQYFTTPATCVSAGPLLFAGSTSADIAYFDEVYIKSMVYNDWVEHWAIGNLEGIYGETTDVYGVAIGRYDTGYTHIKISDDEGFEIWVGDESTTDNRLGQWDASGDFTLGVVKTDSGNMFYDVSAGRLNFRGSTSGTVVESYIDDDGSFVAGGDPGAVIINSDGVEFVNNTGGPITNASIRYNQTTHPTDYDAQIGSYKLSNTAYLNLSVTSDGDPVGIFGIAASLTSAWANFTNIDYVQISTGDLYVSTGGISTGAGNAYTTDITVAGGMVIGDTGTDPGIGNLYVSGGLRVGDTTAPTTDDIRATGDIVAGDGLYVGNVAGEPAADCVIADGDGRFAGGLAVGSSSLNNGAGYASFTAGIRVGDATASTYNDDIVATGGIIVGSTATNPPAGDMRCTGGLSVGSATVNNGAGYASFTAGIRVGDTTAASYNDDITCTGGIVAGSNGTNPVAGNIHATVALHAPQVFVNETLNGEQTYGITIKTTNATEVISLKETGVSHGMTTPTEADTFGAFSVETDNSGGLLIEGYTETDTGVRVQGRAVTPNTTTGITALGVIEAKSGKRSGVGPGTTSLGSTENVFVVLNLSTAEFIVKGNGAAHVNLSTGSSNVGLFDEYDDMKLLAGVRGVGMPMDHYLRTQFNEFIEYARPALEAANVITVNDGEYGNSNDGSVFMNIQGMFKLHNDAIRQSYHRSMTRIDQLEQALLAAGISLPASKQLPS